MKKQWKSAGEKTTLMLKDMAMPENNDILSLRQVAKEINKVLDSESGQIKTLLKENPKKPQNVPKILKIGPNCLII